MQRGQFSQEQLIAILHQAEKGEQTIPSLCREHSNAETAFYRWRKADGGMTVSEAQRLKALEKENARLKRLLAERAPALNALQEYADRSAGKQTQNPGGITDAHGGAGTHGAGVAPTSEPLAQ